MTDFLNDFINSCASDCVNAVEYKDCPRCFKNLIESDMVYCVDCDYQIQSREAGNDSGV